MKALIDEEPEGDTKKSMHESLYTYQQNRDRLRQTVNALGYNKGKGRGAGKGGKSYGGGKLSKKGGSHQLIANSKTKGLGKGELKKITSCLVCGKKGHWKGDPECSGMRDG